MPAISITTREAIKAYLEVFIERLVKEYKKRPLPTLGSPEEYLAQKSSKGQLKPFHAAIIPSSLLRINEFERGFSTSLGTSYEECAKLIAREHHAEASRSYDIEGSISEKAISEIERQVAIFERTADSEHARPTLDAMIKAVLDSREEGEQAHRIARADLYIRTHNGIEFFFEMKSPMPNKGQCLEVTQRLLRFHLLRGKPRPNVQAFFSMAYNPYGSTRADYKWSMAKKYTPFDQVIVIGHEFWNIVGGATCYGELLEIYQEVGREKSKYMLDALAFGF